MSALALILVAASMPAMGWAASEHHSGRKFYGVFEGDWMFHFALIAGMCKVVVALAVLADMFRD